ncbi:T9SS type A sorting domain-containing protein [Hymenobacter arizonensis]|uniref:Conserved repeat domain-containing protein/Por secretion system C-terminal sorting domain-containing protein n=1 Tax=Hymenobacter arizonensis TaxID=1227077 RepID=A0A1I5X976_HYMAR|nr:T9SS type A sorting domain-containing protein [Hymenobacter arizonensis]SFQ28187.1 conserved repeat domain-containing protein/Por secretion system C-terminal sorting domain-containing protein [Hymenobacter arizonensis]
MKILHPRFLFALLLLLLGSRSELWAQSFAWARVAGGTVDTAYVRAQASATDAAGNTYIIVNFTNSVLIGTIQLTAPGQRALAVVKYDLAGRLEWAKPLVNISNPHLAADNVAGGVFVVAVNDGGGTWDGAPVPTATGASFYAKCSANGALQWSNSLPVPYYSYTVGDESVVTDASGNAYVSGTVRTASSVGGTLVDASQNYVFKTDGGGAIQWVQVVHGTSTTTPFNYLKLGPKPAGGCLISGFFDTTGLYLGSGTGTPLLTGTTLQYGTVSSFDAAGTHQWSRLVGTGLPPIQQASASIAALAADASGNVYATGEASGNFQVGSTTINGFMLLKYDAAGALQWVRTATPGGGYSSGRLLTVTSSGPTVVVQGFVTVGTLTLRAPFNFVHFNDQGLPQWVTADAYVPQPAATTPYFVPTGMGSDAQGNMYPVGSSSFSYAVTLPAVQLGAQTAVGTGAIVARLNAYANTLRGNVYFDANANGVQDSGEGVFPRQTTGVLEQGTATIYSPVGPDGVLQVYADPGAYTLRLGSLPAHYTVSQPVSGAYTGSFSGSNQLVSGQNFGIAPIANLPDLRITLTPYNLPRAGETTQYRLTLENVGTTTLPAGSVTLTLDALAQYIRSTPSGTVSGQVIRWNYGALAPFNQLNYDVLWSLPVTIPLATPLTTTAAAPVTGDVAPNDNTVALAQTVVGPYDPNSIEVNYEFLTPAQVTAQQPLDYTIHFQNLGTASATTVILSDTLDFRKLNLNSLLVIAQSHNCVWSLTSNGLLTVRFPNINLPESSADEMGSQGFVRFRVQPRSTLTVGEIVPNEAGIVFDYNEPVITNTATTTVFLATATLVRHDATAAWTAYPNPATDVVTVSADLATAGPVRIELIDALGRTVRQQTLQAPAGALRQTLDLRGLAAGVYVLRLTPPTGSSFTRRLVHE